MAIFRGNGGSVEGITESDTVIIAISQGGTGATTASGARSNLGLGTAATTNSTAYATAAQGALADSALQSFTETDPVFSASEAASITSTDTTNWDTAYTDRLKWDGGSTGLNASTGRTSLGLGTAATTASTDYATAAQGSLADSAVQPGDLATVATSGSYNDLSNKPTIPSDLNSLTDVVITTPSTNQVLQYNGTNWVNATGGGGGSGTVTSVDMSVPTGLAVSGNPITSSGTLAVTYASGYSIPTTTKQTEWDTAYTDRLKWDGGSTGLTASTGRTSLGATTIGSNLFTLTNPSAVTFPRFNADNTVSSLSASDFRTAISAGTVTSVNLTAGTGISVSGGPVTSSGSITVTNSAPMTYPSSGVAVSTGSAWNTPLSYGTTATASSLVQLDAGGYANTNNTFGFKNRIINGAMMIDQRNAGASVTVNSSASFFGVDRWFATGQGTDGVFTVQQSSTAPTGFKNSLLATVTTADASIGASQIYVLGQRIEGLNVSDLGWGATGASSVTLSFWVRSSITGTFGGCVTNETGYSYPFTYTISAANTFEQKTVTITGPTAGTWLTNTGVGVAVIFTLGSGSTFSGSPNAWASSVYYGATGQTQIMSTNGATFYITGVQLEKGSTATSFDYRPYGTELVLCQRYYQRIGGNDSNTLLCSGVTYNSVTHILAQKFTTTMRASPTGSVTSGTNFGIIGNNFVASCTSVTVYTGGTDSTRVDSSTGSVTAGGGANLYPNAANTAILLSAEL